MNRGEYERRISLLLEKASTPNTRSLTQRNISTSLDPKHKFLLESYPWSFARKRKVLAPLRTEAPPGNDPKGLWKTIYPRPLDSIGIMDMYVRSPGDFSEKRAENTEMIGEFIHAYDYQRWSGGSLVTTYSQVIPVEDVKQLYYAELLIAAVAQEVAPLDSPKLTQYLATLVTQRQALAIEIDAQATRSQKVLWNRNMISQARQGRWVQYRSDLD